MPSRMTNKLFQNSKAWQTEELIGELKGIHNTCRNPTGIHSLNTRSYSRLHRDIVRAMYNICGQEGEIDNFLYGDFAVQKVSSNLYAAERKLADGTHDICIYNTNGDIKASYITATGRYMHFDPISESDNTDITVICLCLIAACADIDNDVKEMVDSMIATFDTSLNKESMFYICDAVYQHVNYGGDLPVNIPADGNIDWLRKREVSSGAYKGTVIYGESNILSGESGVLETRALKQNITMKEAKKEFAKYAKQKTWTEEEQRLIPHFSDDFLIPPEALKIARRFVNTSNDERPMRNFMWRGITSYGKSTGVEATAAMLNTPLLRMTCHTNMETQQFLSDFVPDTTNSVSTSKLPDFETIQNDPEGAYYQITGVENEDATQDTCLQAYGEAVASQNSSVPRFKHVESNFVKALTRGYIVEVQECSRIKDSGVLVGLNEYDRPGAIIPLIDGSYSVRDENAMVVYTDNVGYASCHPIDPSVLRRMAFVMDRYEMPKEQVISRIKYNTKYEDDSNIETCYNIWHDLKEFAKEHDITEGSISVTELEMLVQSIKYDGLDNLGDNVRECIISKATSDIEEQGELLTAYETNLGRYLA